MPIKIKVINEIKRKIKRASLKRKIETYEILLKSQENKGLGEFSLDRRMVEQNLIECKNALEKI